MRRHRRRAWGLAIVWPILWIAFDPLDEAISFSYPHLSGLLWAIGPLTLASLAGRLCARLLGAAPQRDRVSIVLASSCLVANAVLGTGMLLAWLTQTFR